MRTAQTSRPEKDWAAPQWTRGLAALAVLVAGYVAWHWGPLFSGDALIHVIFMENAANGHWFEFNRGIPDASSTSALWTVVGAVLWRLGGVTWTLGGIKLLCVAAWLGNAWLAKLLAQRLGATSSVATLLGLLLLADPSSGINALMGMENAFFSCMVLGAALALVRQVEAETPGLQMTAAAFGLLGLAVATRPEGVVPIGVVGGAWVLWMFRQHRDRLLLHVAVAAVAGGVGALLFWGVYMVQTGRLVPASGVSRLMVARRGPFSLQLGKLWIYGRPLVYLAVHAPLVLGALAALRRTSGPDRRWSMRVVVVAVAIAAVGLYAFVTGAAHATRYLIWVYALLAAAAAPAFSTALQSERRLHRTVAILGLLWLTAASVADVLARTKGDFTGRVWGYPEHEVVAALENRTTRTDKLLARLCAGGCCRDDLVPTVTLREVQERFWLDDRIRVAALDGVVIGPFAEVMEYRDDGCPRMDRFEADPSLLGVLERPADAMNLDRCTDHPWVRGVNDAFTARSSSLPGWRWDNAGELLIRECSR